MCVEHMSPSGPPIQESHSSCCSRINQMRVVSEIDNPSMFIQGSGVDDGLRSGGGGLYFSHKTCSLSDLFIQYPTTSSQKALAHVLAGKMAISNKQSAINSPHGITLPHLALWRAAPWSIAELNWYFSSRCICRDLECILFIQLL